MRINTKQGLAPIVAIIIALLALGGGAYGIKKSVDNKKAKKAAEEQVQKEKEKAAWEEAKTPTTLQIKLDEQGTSGQGGQAVIVPVGTSTVRVIVNLVGKPSAVAQPSHIHLGACPTPGAVKYPLTNVDKGASQTDILNLSIEQLLAELPLSINVHKSGSEPTVYVACGNIVAEDKGAESDAAKVKDEKGDEKKSTGTEQGETVKTKETKVIYNSSGFSPKSVTIKKGEIVVFENKTGKSASVASDEHPAHLLYPEFDQYKTDQRGKTEFRFTFDKVGTWKYHDHLNAAMGGTVVVTE